MKKSEKYVYIFVFLFIILNIFNSYLVSTNIFNKEITIYPRSLQMVFSSLLGDLGVILVLLAIGIILFKKINRRFLYYFIITIILSIIIYSISMYLQYFGTFFSFKNSNVFENDAGGIMIAQTLQAVVELVKEHKIIYFAPILIIGVIMLLNRKKQFISNEVLPSNFIERHRIQSGLFLLLIGILMSFGSINYFQNHMNQSWFGRNRIPLFEAETVGTYNFYVSEFFEVKFGKKEEATLTQEQEINMQNLLNYYSDDCHINIFDNQKYCTNGNHTGIASGYNIVYIQLESISDFVINRVVNGIEVTPNLNRLAADGIYFSNYYTDVGIGNTADNEFTVNTGMFPDGNNVMFFEYANQTYQTLAGSLKSAGYGTYSFHGNDGQFYDRENVHENTLGYDEHYTIDELEQDDIIFNYLSDESLFRQTYEHIQNYQEPFLVYDITVTSHLPYTDDDEIKKYDWGNNLKNTMLGRFLDHARYVDDAIGNFMNMLQDGGYLDHTIVFIASDHGGSISKDELDQLIPNISKLEYRKLMMKIPLIVYNPDLLGLNDINLVRSPRDISRTITNLLGIPTTYYFGVDALEHEPSFAYNPRSLDFVYDDYFISAISGEYLQMSDTKPLLPYNEYINYFLDFKDTQDNIIHFDYLGKEEDIK